MYINTYLRDVHRSAREIHTGAMYIYCTVGVKQIHSGTMYIEIIDTYYINRGVKKGTCKMYIKGLHTYISAGCI